MKLACFFIAVLVIFTSLGGCLEDSGDPGEEIEYQDSQGNLIMKKDGKRYFIDPFGEETRLDGGVEELTPDSLVSGMRNSLSFTGKGTVVLVLPQEILPVIQNRVLNQSVILFQDGGELEVIAAPDLNVTSGRGAVEIQVLGKGKDVFPLTIEEGAEPMVSGQYWYDLEYLVTDDVDGYNGRYVGAGSPQLERAAAFFRDEFESFGLEAEVQRFTASSSADNFVLNVVAYKWGLIRDEWIVVGGHFDVAPAPNGMGTWEGAYDNTAGSCAVVSLAKGLAGLETNRTIVFGLWSSEEEGLHGSRAFVNDLPPDVTVKAHINLDMIGLVYPSPQKTCNGMVFPNDNATAADHPHFLYYINHTIHNLLRLPRDIDVFNIREGGTSASDHYSFYSEGIPSVFFISGPVSHYHDPYDDLEHLTEDAGGVELLIAGVQTALWINFYLIIYLDNESYVHP